MHRRWFAAALPLLLTACPGPTELDELEPYRGDWITLTSDPLPFVHTDGDGTPLISTITIGGKPVRSGGNENFANRGDVIVEFWDREEIKRFSIRRTEPARTYG